MLRRVLDKKHVRNAAYKNVSVCDRWLCFDYFCEDASKIEGWDEKKFLNKEIELDKDYKQLNQTYKIYSKETCIWINKKDNNKFQPNHCKKFKATSPEDKELIYFSQHECARENNLSVSHINLCLNGKRKSYKGWTFKFI